MYKRLEKIMRDYGIRQLELAKVLNVTPLTIIYRLNGYRAFKLDEAFKIKNYLNSVLNENFTIEEIFEKEEK